MRITGTKWVGIAAALTLAACGGDGSESSASSSGPHDFFDGVWQVTSAVGKPPQEFQFYRAYDGTVRVGGWVFYPSDPDRVSYVGAESLSLDGSAVTGNALITVTLEHEFTVPLSVTFDSSTHFAGTLGSVSLEGSR
jgi:hypothetical protein